MRVIIVCGTRPNFVKIAPLVSTFAKAGIEVKIAHTGQHYDALMNDVFFEDLDIPKPDWCLGIGSGTQGFQVGTALVELEKIFLAQKPDAIVIVGDVNSTLAGALAGASAQIPVAHVEAGLRSWDTTMPEEIDRMLADRVSALLFTPTREASEILRREGASETRIVFAGNIMAETLLSNCASATERHACKKFGQGTGSYIFATCHRPENVDDPAALRAIIEAFERAPLPVILPVHPRTRPKLETELGKLDHANINFIDPVGYLDALSLEADAALIVTDSAGVSQEAIMLKTPCIVVRRSSERTVTSEYGFHVEIAANTSAILGAIEAARSEQVSWRAPEHWDTGVSKRIADALIRAHEKGFPPLEYDLITGKPFAPRTGDA